MPPWTCISKTVSANLWLPKWDNSVIPAKGFAGELTDGRSPLPIWREHRFNQLTLSFSTWHRHWEMYLDLRPPRSPRRLLTSLFFCDLTAAIATEHFATCRRDKPGPSLAVASCFVFRALPDGGERDGDKTGWWRELVQCWGCWLFMLGAWFVSTLLVFFPSCGETFRLNFVPDIGKSRAVSCLWVSLLLVSFLIFSLAFLKPTSWNSLLNVNLFSVREQKQKKKKNQPQMPSSTTLKLIKVVFFPFL